MNSTFPVGLSLRIFSTLPSFFMLRIIILCSLCVYIRGYPSKISGTCGILVARQFRRIGQSSTGSSTRDEADNTIIQPLWLSMSQMWSYDKR
ncbi:uncharacterized protein GGS22DRAFT_152903, partial [Annulohypoxylon maeteangense]|uniref:uncharacterized protein n=1 Tax=Annulohypoxylon maeteangense TaxID=1927788 RepID=UPI002007F061